MPSLKNALPAVAGNGGASASGGNENTASGLYASVSGGQPRRAGQRPSRRARPAAPPPAR